MMDNSVVSRKMLGKRVSEEKLQTEDDDKLKAADFVNAELVEKIRSKFSCCLVDWILLLVCAKSKYLP